MHKFAAFAKTRPSVNGVHQWMGYDSEWGTTVSGNVCVSGMHNYAFNRFDAC